MARKKTTIDARTLIPLIHTTRPEEFWEKPNFYTDYDRTEVGEVGCIYDEKTGKPIARIIDERVARGRP